MNTTFQIIHLLGKRFEMGQTQHEIDLTPDSRGMLTMRLRRAS